MKANTLLITLVAIILSLTAAAQPTKFTQAADSLYKAKNFTAAGPAYLLAADSSNNILIQKNCIYNAACCFALANDTVRAVQYLDKAVFVYGYKNAANILNDADLISLHNTAVWTRVAAYIDSTKQALHNPANAKLITTDIHHFWTAYDMVQKDTAHILQIFQREYF